MAKTKKAKGNGEAKAAEYVDSLLELHKLEAVLLNKLKKSVQRKGGNVC